MDDLGENPPFKENMVPSKNLLIKSTIESWCKKSEDFCRWWIRRSGRILLDHISCPSVRRDWLPELDF